MSSAWDSKVCTFCMTKRPEFVGEYHVETNGEHPQFACCRWCKRLLLRCSGDVWMFSLRYAPPRKAKKKHSKEALVALSEKAELLDDINDFLKGLPQDATG